jgi:RNA polymerase sigma-70 factor (ECF subfamily)
MDNKPLQLLSDQELIKAYNSSDNNQYAGVLYKRYVHLVYGLCYKYLENHHDAEDATTNIFCLVMEKLKENTITYFKSWLYIVSKNYILSCLRKQKTNQVTHVEEFSDDFMENEPETRLNIKELQGDSNDLLKIGLENLKEAQQVCVELFYIQDKSYVHIAEVTGFDIKQVKSHIQNGKRNLKIFLESKGYQYEQ